MNTSIQVGNVYPGKGLSMAQLLYALEREIPQNMLHRPQEMTAEYVLERLEEEATVAAHMRHLLNTFNTAAQLPPEILTMLPSFPPIDRELFTISQVCHHWRTVIVSCSLLWRRINCEELKRTILGLERCGSVPLRLELSQSHSTQALNMVLRNKCKIASFAADLPLPRIRTLCNRLLTNSVGELILSIHSSGRLARGKALLSNIQGEFPLMQKLSVSGFGFLPINRIKVPNLKHLSLETSLHRLSPITAKSILDLLRRCSRLETIFINTISEDDQHIPHACHPINLPALRCIELGHLEVMADIIIPLRFPPGVAVGFRGLEFNQETLLCRSIQKTLSKINIEAVTFAFIPRNTDYTATLSRFEGPNGSLEVTFNKGMIHRHFRPEGLLNPHRFHFKNVNFLRIASFFHTGQILADTAEITPNVTSIEFIGYHLTPLTLKQEDDSPIPFPHLKHVAGLPASRGTANIVKNRKAAGVPLDALDLVDSEWQKEYIEDLREHVKAVNILAPEDFATRWIDNALLNVWKEAGYRVPDLPDWMPEKARAN